MMMRVRAMAAMATAFGSHDRPAGVKMVTLSALIRGEEDDTDSKMT